MKAKPAMSLAEMAAKAAGNGGRLVCPRCNCPELRTYGTQPGHASTFRYKACRHCGHRIVTAQQPETFIRDVVPHNENEADQSEGDIL